MEALNHKPEFVQLVKESLNLHLGISLSEEYVISSTNSERLTVDLADVRNHTFVEILEGQSAGDRDVLVKNISRIVNGVLSSRNFKLKEYRFYFVFDREVGPDEIEFFQKRFPNSGSISYDFYEPKDLEPGVAEPEQPEEDVNLDQLGNRKIWLGGHLWGDENQMDRFVADDIFETGEEENALYLVEVGDLILMKSTFAQGGKGHMRIKGLGVVFDNPLNGHSLGVRWYMFDDHLDTGLGQYRRAFQRLMPRFYGPVISDLLIHLPQLFEIINELESPASGLQYRKETPITKDEKVWYGQQLGDEISQYNVFFLPKSIYGGIGQNGIAAQVLKILDLKKESFPFDESYLTGLGYQWVKVEYFDRVRYFCFVVSKGEDKGALDFEQNLVQAVQSFSTSFKDDDLQMLPKAIFIPFIGAGQSKMDKQESLDKILSGVQQMFESYESPKVRINFPREISEEEKVDYCKTILERLNREGHRDLNLLRVAAVDRKLNMIPRTINDGAHGKVDYLGFESDIRVFASLMARKDLEPPFAIALFGAWGKGKSFFMNRLKTRIGELSEYGGFMLENGDTDDLTNYGETINYCKGVAQIHFNAWSYVDANLWAGLVSTIFERLNVYLTENTSSQVAKLRVQEALVDQLKALNTLSQNVRGKKDALQQLKDGYEKEKSNIREKQKQLFEDEILAIINADPDLKKLHHDLQSSGFIDAKKEKLLEDLNLETLAGELDAWKIFLANFKKFRGWGLYVAIPIITVGITLGLDFALQNVSNWWYLAGGLSTLILPGFDGKKVTGVYKTASSFRDRFNRVVGESEKHQKTVRNYERQIKATEKEIELAENRLEELDQKIKKTEFDIQFNLVDLTIADFIQGRANHEDYKSKTGIISTIRRDFELLSDLFGELKKESLNEERQQKIKEDRAAIDPMFKPDKKLERIILYIDDLDRCTDEKVLEVLQAVHLLMAFPLFMVVVGVDKRCVNNALRYRNILQYAKQTGISKIKDLENNFDLRIIHPDEYLEKIFQIPYHIPEAANRSIETMIDALLDDTPVVSELEKEIAAAKKETQRVVIENVKKGVEAQQAAGPDMGKDQTAAPKKWESEIAQEEEEEQEEVEAPAIIDLTISDWELDQIKYLAPGIIGTSPRTIKRFINVYRLIRAHGEYEHEKFTRHEKLFILLLVAIHAAKGAMADQLCTELVSPTGIDVDTVFQNEAFHSLSDLLAHRNGDEVYQNMLSIPASRAAEFVPLVRRFSFREQLITSSAAPVEG